MKKYLILGVVGALGAGLVWWMLGARVQVSAPEAEEADAPRVRVAAAAGGEARSAQAADSSRTASAGTAEDAENAAPDAETDEEKAAAEEERLVDAFDDLTDVWMDAEKKNSPTMKDVEKFVSTFRSVPKGRKDECVHRALNLIPDENVMLLAGILMDKSMDKEIVETVFGDVLNRDESVKKPIMDQIFKDKTHPCWTDVAWIKDVTGDLAPKEGAVTLPQGAEK